LKLRQCHSLRHTTEETQKHYTHDDTANLADAVKGIGFEG